MEHSRRTPIWCTAKEQGGRIFSCTFAFLLNKTETFYMRFYQELFNSLNWNDSQDILQDFEKCVMHTSKNIQQQIVSKVYL